MLIYLFDRKGSPGGLYHLLKVPYFSLPLRPLLLELSDPDSCALPLIINLSRMFDAERAHEIEC